MIVLLMTVSACSQISSNEVDTTSIYGELSLKREEGAASGTAKAIFFVGGGTGSVVKMDSPAKVEINGRVASEVTEPIINLITYQGSVSTDASISYTDKDGGIYTNILRLPGDMTATMPGSAFIAQGFSVNYSSTTPFIAGEKLQVTISNSNQTHWFSRNLVIGANSGTVTITSSDLSGFSAGSALVSVCRESRPNAVAPYPKGTIVHIESCSSQRTVSLQP